MMAFHLLSYEVIKMDFHWEDGEDKTEKLYIPQLRLTLFVINKEKGWIAFGKFDDTDKIYYQTDPFKTKKEAKKHIITFLCAGLAKCQFDLLASIFPKK